MRTALSCILRKFCGLFAEISAGKPGILHVSEIEAVEQIEAVRQIESVRKIEDGGKTAAWRMRMKFAVIPAYQPDGKLPCLAQELKQQGFQVLIVDDGSGAAYAGIFREAEKAARVVSYPVNRGKGYALKTAYACLRGMAGDGGRIVTLDCDGPHRVEDAVRLCDVSMDQPDALFLGSRKQSTSSPLRSRFGNAVTRGVFRLATGTAVYDTQTGLRAFSARLLTELMEIPGERYEYETNVLLYCARRGVPIREIPIQTVYLNANAGSHFHVIRDSWRIYREVLKFSASSLAGFLTDYSLYSLLVCRGVPPLRANIAARCVSAVVNFSLNRRFVFQDGGPLWKSAARYFALALGILTCNTALLGFLTAAGVHALGAKLITEILLFLCSYLVQKNYIFYRKVPS